MTPACFDSESQWKGWLAAARMMPPPQKDGYCADCTPGYQERMMACGRCEHPKTRFVEDGDDFRGVRYE